MSEYAPTFEILVGRDLLPAEYVALISSVVVKATIDGADELVIAADAWDPISNDFRILGETILGLGNAVVIRMGYADSGDIRALQRFRLLRSEPTYQAGARPTITLRGYSAEHRLVEFTSPRKFPVDLTYEDMAAEIAEFHGLDPAGISQGATVTDTGRSTVKAKGDTDLKFLQQMAYLAGHGPPIVQYDEDLDVDVLFFRTPQLDQQTDNFVFTYDPHLAGSERPSGNCYSFRPKLSLAGVPTKVQVTGFDDVAQEPIRVTIEITDGGQETTIQTGKEVGKIDEAIRSGAELQVVVLEQGQDIAELEKKEALTVLHIRTTEAALSYAQRWFRTRLEAFMTARAEVAGTPGLWVGQIHTFDGLAPEHNGLWEFVGVTHTSGQGGYVCSCDLVRVIDATANEPIEV